MVAPIKLLKKPKASPLVCFDPDPRAVESSHTLAFRGLSRAYSYVEKNYTRTHITATPLRTEDATSLQIRLCQVYAGTQLDCYNCGSYRFYGDSCRPLTKSGVRPHSGRGTSSHLHV